MQAPDAGHVLGIVVLGIVLDHDPIMDRLMVWIFALTRFLRRTGVPPDRFRGRLSPDNA